MAIVTAEQVRAEVDRLPPRTARGDRVRVLRWAHVPAGRRGAGYPRRNREVAHAARAGPDRAGAGSTGSRPRMDVTRNEFQDLVGAYALDACDPEEAAAIDAYVADARRRGRRGRAAARRRGVARRGRRAEPAASRCATACSPWRPSASTRCRRSTRSGARPSASRRCSTRSTPADLDVRDLQRSDRARSRRARRDRRRGVRRRRRPAPSHVVVHRCRRGRGDDRARAAGDGRLVVRADPSTASARPGGADRPRRAAARRHAASAATRCESALVIRAFETWTHHDDIAAALGRAEAPVGGAGAAHDGRARDPDAAARARGQGLRLSRAGPRGS